MKILLSLFLVLPFCAFSQVNYKKMSVSAGGGITVPHADITDFNIEPVVNGALHYNITPFAAVGLDAEVGKLSGNYHQLHAFTNKFVTAALDGRLQMGQFMEDHLTGFSAIISKLYLGAGIGMIHSNAESGPPEIINSDESVEGELIKYKGTDIIAPVFVGANLPIMKELDLEVLTLFINYRLNISFSDDLDALATTASTSNDYFSTLSVGIRLNFGSKEPYFFGNYR